MVSFKVKHMVDLHHYLIAFGANLPSKVGEPIKTIRSAALLLAEGCSGELIWGKLYQSSAVPASDQPDFVNTVVGMMCAMEPADLLQRVLEIEKAFGRERRDRWSARTLDIDILAMSDCVLPNRDTWHAIAEHDDPAAISEVLMLPHPRLHKRQFVLRPLCDVDPAWRHPVLGQTAQQLLNALKPPKSEKIWCLDDDFS